MDLSILQPFHRTESLDYAIVAKGSVVLQIDDGKKVTLNGDILCQRGTAHAWRNESSEWARVYFVRLVSLSSVYSMPLLIHPYFRCKARRH